MDALKTGEVIRMEQGGNKPWKDFFNGHQSNTLIGRDFESCTIAERYDSEAGEEWKERLTAKVEGTEYVPGAPKPKPAVKSAASTVAGSSGRNTPSSMSSAPQRTVSPSQKSRNEAYFSRMGEANASRPDDLPPNQGGKFAGFGSSPMPTSGSNSSGLPLGEDFQKDPVAALTKGFGWLSSTVTKQAAAVNKSYIQPSVKSLQEGELAANAQRWTTQIGSQAQQGVKGLGDQFNKFVDPEHPATGSSGVAGRQRSAAPEKQDFWDSFGQAPEGPPQEKKDFWDDFAAAGEAKTQAQQAKPTSIGTSAMKPSSGSGSGGAAKKEEGDGWGEW